MAQHSDNSRSEHPRKNLRGNQPRPALAGHDNPIEASVHPVMDTFRLVAEAHRQAAIITESAKDAVKQFYRDPKALAIFIERHSTPVYLVENGMMDKLLLLTLFTLGYDPGFIPPSNEKRYERLQALLKFAFPNSKGHCHFDAGVFILTKPLFTVGFMSHQLHHWLAFRSGMRGYCDRSQQLYKKFWNEQNGMLGTELYDMTADDIIALKSAINRDLEALQFLKMIANEILIPAKQATRFAYGTASA